MNRLTRPLNSVRLRELLRSFSLRACLTKRRFSRATRPLPHAKHSTPSCPSKPLDFSTSASTANRPSFKPELPETDTKPAELDPPSVENFIHVENPNPNVVEASSDHNIDEASRSKGSDERRNAELPKELSKNVVHLSCKSSAEGGKCDVYLVGTCHVWKASSCYGFCLVNLKKKSSKLIIREFLDDQWVLRKVVFLELCSSRVGVFNTRNVEDIKVPSVVEMVEMWRNKHNLFDILCIWLLAQVGRLLEVVPGSEFRVAYEEARKYDAEVILGDRPDHLKDMDEDDKLTRMMQEFNEKFPTLFETIVDERDQYMSYTLLRAARKHSSVVAVVGRGHLPGIRKYWKQPVSINELTTIPPQTPTLSTGEILAYLAIAIAIAFVSGIVLGIYLASKK
ncbi:hypothetical protein V6N13_077255 [Hibiscus sabdariffa]|uniref:TraB family protein n=2 Tax=Hibiscus sabdariffa TaxID=183260 RepID=A0ABR2A1E4_9ROSI